MRLSPPLFAAVFSLSTWAHAETDQSNWPQFRGPQGNGVLETLEHPESWSNQKNVAWSIELPGGGLSSPIVIGDRVFVTTAVGMGKPVSFAAGVRDMRPKTPNQPLEFRVICLRLSDGRQLWEQTLAKRQPSHPIHASNSYATESPASDGERIYVHFACIGLVAALDLDGKQLWSRELGSYPTGNGFGTGSSITTSDGKLFVQVDNDQQSFVVALNTADGKDVWRQPRNGRTSWSTPLVWDHDLRSELVVCGSGFVTSYDPDSGNELWKLENIGMSFSASPAMDGDRIYFGNSGPRSNGPLVAVRAGMNGVESFSAEASIDGMDWSVMQAGPGMSSPVALGGRVYIPSRGKLSCYAADSGELIYKTRIPLGSLAASMWAAGDRVFLMDETGKTLVLADGPEYRVLQTNQLEGDLFWSTPAVSGNNLLIRGAERLYCIRPSDSASESAQGTGN